MRQNIKICLPAYKICYACLYFVFLSLVRGIAYLDEIGTAMDANVAPLAMVFCAETYCMEWSGKRREIFVLYEVGRKSRMVRERLLIQMVFLWALACGGYFCFFWQRPIDRGVASLGELYGSYVAAVTVTVFFWSVLTMTISNLMGNQWAGIGICVLLWLLITSKPSQELLGDYSIFAYGFGGGFGQDRGWLAGKAAGFLAGLGMTGLIPCILKRRE